MADLGLSPAAEGSPEPSSLSTMSIINIGPLNLAVVHCHYPHAGYGTSCTPCSVSSGVLMLLPEQERVGGDQCWVRTIGTILPQRSDASIAVLVPVRAR